jgi:hypothetical protein
MGTSHLVNLAEAALLALTDIVVKRSIMGRIDWENASSTFNGVDRTFFYECRAPAFIVPL